MAAGITLLLAALCAGSLVFVILAIEAARRYLTRKLPQPAGLPPISVLKPLAGVDLGLEANLRSFFEQDYPEYEIVMATSTEDDPALEVARRLQQQYPHRPSRLVIAGEPPYPNRKVRSIHCMIEAAKHELLVMSDSDIRVAPDFLRRIAAEFSDPALDLVTCPYRAAPGPGFWWRLEAVMMNTEFLAGILAARMMEGMRFAVGPTIACRRPVVEAIGGFETLSDYLAEDFVFGRRAAELGFGVELSRCVVEHHIGGGSFRENLPHRLRWVRSTRRSRPAGYIGQLFTYPIPLSLLLLAWAPRFWPMVVAALLLRAINAWQVAGLILKDPLVRRCWWMVPLQDIVSFLFWMAGFFGDTIVWRGKKYRLAKAGRFARL